ncbi:EAL domain-containing protein [Paenibacillus thalictri]|nr:EAL domain-containing protein [Paenibacillus thalictri]
MDLESDNKGKYGVLIVDDSILMRQMTAGLFHQDPQFYIAGTASNGLEAIELAGDLRLDLIVMDVEMPEMDGISALKQIMARYPVPVIMLSSYTGDGAPQTIQAMKAGAIDYFHKDMLFQDHPDPMLERDFLLRCKLAVSSRTPSSGGAGFNSFKELTIKVLMESITHCMKLEDDLRATHTELKKTLFQQKGLVLKFKLNCGKFIHSMCEGDMFGITSAQVVGKELIDFFPEPLVTAHLHHYGKAWGGDNLTNFESTWRGRHFYTTLRPLWRQGEVSEVVCLIMDITEQRQTEERIHYLSNHDHLTSLPNRKFLSVILNEVTQRSAADSTSFAVFCVGLDHFKLINEGMGYETGDYILRVMAKRLKRCTVEETTIARVGGDTFVFVVTGVNPQDMVKTAEQIIHTVRQPIKLEGYELHMTSSVGISHYPFDANDADNLLKCADMAMHAAKDHGRNHYEFYSSSLNERLHRRMKIEQHLRKAIEYNEFVLYYQPIVDAATRRIVSMESLIRWDSQELGRVPPVEFIPIAEETGIIQKIGEWVLAEACRQNKAWQSAGLSPITVTVNLSSKQFYDPHLKELIMRILHETGLASECLELEITESTTMDVGMAMDTLRGLKELGLKIAIDDFGTGYSSFSYLKEFPIDKLKIDQSFVKDIHLNPVNAAIVDTIVTMTRHLKLQVVAEGVENEEVLDTLERCGCGLVQGYLFSMPVDGEKAKHLILSHELDDKAVLSS